MGFVCSPPPTCFSPSLHNLNSSKISSSIFLIPQNKIYEVSPDMFFFYLSLAFCDIYTIHTLYTTQNTIIRILLCLTTSTSTALIQATVTVLQNVSESPTCAWCFCSCPPPSLPSTAARVILKQVRTCYFSTLSSLVTPNII